MSAVCDGSRRQCSFHSFCGIGLYVLSPGVADLIDILRISKLKSCSSRSTVLDPLSPSTVAKILPEAKVPGFGLIDTTTCSDGSSWRIWHKEVGVAGVVKSLSDNTVGVGGKTFIRALWKDKVETTFPVSGCWQLKVNIKLLGNILLPFKSVLKTKPGVSLPEGVLLNTILKVPGIEPGAILNIPWVTSARLKYGTLDIGSVGFPFPSTTEASVHMLSIGFGNELPSSLTGWKFPQKSSWRSVAPSVSVHFVGPSIKAKAESAPSSIALFNWSIVPEVEVS